WVLNVEQNRELLSVPAEPRHRRIALARQVDHRAGVPSGRDHDPDFEWDRAQLVEECGADLRVARFVVEAGDLVPLQLVAVWVARPALVDEGVSHRSIR